MHSFVFCSRRVLCFLSKSIFNNILCCKISKNDFLMFIVTSEEEKVHFMVWVQASASLSLLTGHGDQRDVSSENSEGGGGWSHSWDEGAGGHHRVYQAGADSKCSWQAQPLLSGLLRVKWWGTAAAQSWLMKGSGISLSIILNNTGELFFLYYCSAPFLLCLSQPLQVFHKVLIRV